MESIGRLIIVLGIILLLTGGIVLFLGRVGVSSLPGDLSFRRGNFRIFIPLGTSLLLSVVLTILLNLIIRK